MTDQVYRAKFILFSSANAIPPLFRFIDELVSIFFNETEKNRYLL